MSDSFLTWWRGDDSPARRMSDNLATQVEWVARAAFNAGNHQRHLRRERVPAERANFSLEGPSD